MSIINPMSLDGGGWNVAINRSNYDDELAFDVTHEPSEWVVFRINQGSIAAGNRQVCYICNAIDETTYYDYTVRALSSLAWIQVGNKARGQYANGSFYITVNGTATPIETYSSGVGDYVLIYT